MPNVKKFQEAPCSPQNLSRLLEELLYFKISFRFYVSQGINNGVHEELNKIIMPIKHNEE